MLKDVKQVERNFCLVGNCVKHTIRFVSQKIQVKGKLVNQITVHSILKDFENTTGQLLYRVVQVFYENVNGDSSRHFREKCFNRYNVLRASVFEIHTWRQSSIFL